MEDIQKDTQALMYTSIVSSLGFIVGLVYAFKLKSGISKGILFTFIGSVAGAGIGYSIGSTIKKK